MKPEYPEKTTDLSQVTAKPLSHNAPVSFTNKTEYSLDLPEILFKVALSSITTIILILFKLIATDGKTKVYNRTHIYFYIAEIRQTLSNEKTAHFTGNVIFLKYILYWSAC
jgi:hypothetical protein